MDIICNQRRKFIDDVTNKYFEYSLVQLYSDGSYHCNIFCDGNFVHAHACRTLVEQHHNIRVWSINENQFI